MPNGGFISCHYCTYNNGIHSHKIFDICDLYGIQTGPHIICRAFRMPKQSHVAARKNWEILNNLKAGTIYSFDNSIGGPGEFKEMFELKKISHT